MSLRVCPEQAQGFFAEKKRELFQLCSVCRGRQEAALAWKIQCQVGLSLMTSYFNWESSRIIYNWYETVGGLANRFSRKRAREMDDAMGHFTGKLSMLKTRQEQTALEVQSRMNTQADNVLLYKFMSSWKQSSRAENLEKFFHRKLDNKRKQVAGVQTLFETFAKQIEDNLDDDDDEEPGLETRRKARQAKGGMQRGGMAVSLPDIRKTS
eukprot:s319_g25.t1